MVTDFPTKLEEGLTVSLRCVFSLSSQTLLKGTASPYAHCGGKA